MYNIPQEMIDEFNEEMLLNGKYGGSIANRHETMDNIMCDFLRDLGFGVGIDAFQMLDKQYT